MESEAIAIIHISWNAFQLNSDCAGTAGKFINGINAVRGFGVSQRAANSGQVATNVAQDNHTSAALAA